MASKGHGVEYHHRLVHTPHKVVRSLASVGILVGASTAPVLMLLPVMNAVDMLVFGEAPNATKAFGDANMDWTPGLIVATGLPGLLIPVSLAVERFVWGRPLGSVSSIQNRFRWEYASSVAKRVLPAVALSIASVFLLRPPGIPRFNYRALATSAAVLLSLPFASAAEEYAIRGVIARLVSSFFSDADTAFAASATASTLLFAALHMSPSPWTNAYYITAGVCASLMSRWTGGLEASTLVHAASNIGLMLPIVMAENRGIMQEMSGGGGVGRLAALLGVNLVGITWLVRKFVREGS